MILTGKQIRNGRLLAGMSQDGLAKAAGVKVDLVTRAEQTDDTPMMTRFDMIAVRRALKAAGVEFIPENGGGAGVEGG